MDMLKLGLDRDTFYHPHPPKEPYNLAAAMWYFLCYPFTLMTC